MALFCSWPHIYPPRPVAAHNLVKLRIWLAFAVLCLLSGSGWLLKEWQPETVPGLFPVALRSGVLAIAFWAVDQRRSSRRQRLTPGAQALLFTWFLLMVALPTVAIVRAGEHLSPFTETFVFALTPVLVVFFVSQRTSAFGAQESPLRLLAPALAGVAGAALLLPFNLPSSGAGRAWLLALLVTAAVSARGAIQLHQRLAGVPVLRAAAIFSASIFLLSAPLSFGRAVPMSSALEIDVLHSLLLDGPVTLLTVWLLREVSPVAFSSRYLLVLAVTIIEGYLLLQPETSWTTGLGLLLLLSSGAWLLVADSREEVS